MSTRICMTDQVPPGPVRRAALVVAGGELDRRCEECPLFLSGRSPPCPRIEREPIDKTNAKWIGNTTESLKETFPRLRELAHGRTLRKTLHDPEVLSSILCVPEKETLTDIRQWAMFQPQDALFRRWLCGCLCGMRRWRYRRTHLQ